MGEEDSALDEVGLEAAFEEAAAALDSDVWEEAAGTPQLAKGSARHPRAKARIAMFFFMKILLSLRN